MKQKKKKKPSAIVDSKKMSKISLLWPFVSETPRAPCTDTRCLKGTKYFK